ncbi:MAG: 4'-phosphopantetheinyl transferase family protein [Promethearchaeota archaeon]
MLNILTEISNNVQFPLKLIHPFEFKEVIMNIRGEKAFLLISLGNKKDFYSLNLENHAYIQYFFRNEEIEEYLSKNKKYFWLNGRFLVKTAIIKLLKYSNLNYFPYTSIRIIKNTPNRPILIMPEISCNKRIFFSIAHSQEKIIAIASFSQIGADIEKVRKFPPRLLKKFLNPKDFLKIFHIFTKSKAFRLSENEIYTTFWCIKEAVSKATGLGLKLDFRKMALYFKNSKIYVKILNQNKNEIYFVKILKEDNYIIAIAKKLNTY